MNIVDIIASFELEINKINNQVEKPVTDDSLYWINQAVVKFVKDRFNGNAPKRTSYEQNEKRTRDLIKLFVETQLSPTDTDDTHVNYYAYEYEFPEDIMFVLNEDVIITNPDGLYPMDTCVFECTADSFMYRINNSLTDFHYKYHRARPLRIRTDSGFKLLTEKKNGDQTYLIDRYTLGYLKKPTELVADVEQDYTDFEDYTWFEIIKIAAQMYIENQSDQRYQTITNEVLTQE